MTPADSVASPDALDKAVHDESKPQNPGEAAANGQAAGDAIMAEPQQPELDVAVAAAAPADTVGDVVADDEGKGAEAVSTQAVDAQAVNEQVNVPLNDKQGHVGNVIEQAEAMQS